METISRRIRSLVFLILLGAAACGLGEEDRGLAGYTAVDLTHALNEETIYWPAPPGAFEHEALSLGFTEQGYFYSAFALATPEHGGTHLDAPFHFAENGLTADQVPLSSLALPAVVIDVSEKAAADTDYRLSIEDMEAFEAVHGRIPAGAAVLARTGWSRYWPDKKSYLGDDTPGDASNLHFPGFGAEAARFLVEERGVRLLGIDTASIDFGPSTDFPVHRVLAARNIPALENLTNLEALPETGAWLVALPMKIEGGSGAPVRAIALVPTKPSS